MLLLIYGKVLAVKRNNIGSIGAVAFSIFLIAYIVWPVEVKCGICHKTLENYHVCRGYKWLSKAATHHKCFCDTLQWPTLPNPKQPPILDIEPLKVQESPKMVTPEDKS